MPAWLYAALLGVAAACGVASLLFGFSKEDRYSSEMREMAPDDRIPVIATDGTRGTVHRFDESGVIGDGYRVEPRFAGLRSQARAAENLGFVLAFAAAGAASIAAGLLVYRLLRMVLDRFVQPKWLCLVSGLLCAASLWLASGLVLALVELSKLPRVGGHRTGG